MLRQPSMRHLSHRRLKGINTVKGDDYMSNLPKGTIENAESLFSTGEPKEPHKYEGLNQGLKMSQEQLNEFEEFYIRSKLNKSKESQRAMNTRIELDKSSGNRYYRMYVDRQEELAKQQGIVYIPPRLAYLLDNQPINVESDIMGQLSHSKEPMVQLTASEFEHLLEERDRKSQEKFLEMIMKPEFQRIYIGQLNLNQLQSNTYTNLLSTHQTGFSTNVINLFNKVSSYNSSILISIMIYDIVIEMNKRDKKNIVGLPFKDLSTQRSKPITHAVMQLFEMGRDVQEQTVQQVLGITKHVYISRYLERYEFFKELKKQNMQVYSQLLDEVENLSN